MTGWMYTSTWSNLILEATKRELSKSPPGHFVDILLYCNCCNQNRCSRVRIMNYLTLHVCDSLCSDDSFEQSASRNGRVSESSSVVAEQHSPLRRSKSVASHTNNLKLFSFEKKGAFLLTEYCIHYYTVLFSFYS
jgi:hypothetical protein